MEGCYLTRLWHAINGIWHVMKNVESVTCCLHVSTKYLLCANATSNRELAQQIVNLLRK
jgi:hypothetical protein